MKKHFLFVMVVIFMASCSEQQFLHENVNNTFTPQSDQRTSQASILNGYLEKARWGDGSAFLKLAECYHDGIGVKPDFLGTLTMLIMADQYGVPNHSIEDYLMSLPDTDHTKMIFEAIAKLDRRNILPTDSIVENLIANGYADGYALRGVVQVERGDTLGGQQSIKKGAEMGSSFAELLLSVFPIPEDGKAKSLNVDVLKKLSDRSPVANKLLGDIYSGYLYGDAEEIDDLQAAEYYLKADAHGCLGKHPARWLINYYNRYGIQIEVKELERLKVLSGYVNSPEEFVPDSVCIDIECLEEDSVFTER